MVFVSGPRQVGKSTMVESYLGSHGDGVRFNWDVLTDQKKFAKNPYFFEEENTTLHNLVWFDEIHKYGRWKNYLKGCFDKYKNDFLFIVTGSGRLDLFKKGGDSLLGRYLTLPLFPFTLAEMERQFTPYIEWKKNLSHDGDRSFSRKNYETLFNLSGFPDPLFKGEKAYYNLWQQERKTLLIRQDIRDATAIRDLSQLELLSHLLVNRVGSPLSINALREDLGVAFETVRDWIQVLSQFYYLFQIHPQAGSLHRTFRKETKAYLFDWVEIEDPALRFENMVAAHLLKALKTWKSLGEGNLELRYVRDKEKREVDFIVLEQQKPICLVEAKFNDENLSGSLLYYQEKLKVPYAIQLVHKPGIKKKMKKNGKIQWVISADQWLMGLS